MLQSDFIAELHRLLYMRSIQMIERHKCQSLSEQKHGRQAKEAREAWETCVSRSFKRYLHNWNLNSRTSKEYTVPFCQASHVASRDIIIRFGPKDKHALDLNSQPHQLKRFFGLAWLKIAADKRTGIKIPWVAQQKRWKRLRKNITFRYFYDMDQRQPWYFA